jgi:hypothetical protein
MTNEAAQLRLQELLAKDTPYSEPELDELRTLAIQTFYLPNPYSHALPLRSAVEVIDSIRRFDVASGRLIDRTNLLTGWMLGFTILAALLGGGAIWIGWLSYQLALAQASK